ncbi:hypothetical protein Tco_0341385 [Tanacetum coccineum]
MADQEVNVAEKEVSAVDPVTTAGEVVTTASVDISTASIPITVSTAIPTTPLTTTTEDDMTLTETLMEIKSAKPKAIGVVMQEPSEIPRISVAQPQIQEKAQGSRDKAMMEADYQMAERLHSQEQASLTDEQKSSLFVQLLDARKKHLSALRSQEIRNKPPTKKQKRTTMSLKRVNTFMHMDTEKVEGSKAKAADNETRVEESCSDRSFFVRVHLCDPNKSSKRAGEELDRESIKKQKVEDETEQAELNVLC